MKLVKHVYWGRDFLLMLRALIMLIPIPLSGQNLIPNSSFEIIFKPFQSKYSGNIEEALPWFPAGIGSPDIIRNAENYYGKGKAASGDYYAGIILFDEANKDFREYLEIKFTEPLMKNKEYLLRLSVSAAPRSFAFTDELGMLLTKDSLRSGDWYSIKTEPTFKTPKYAAISDTGIWKSFEFKFVAVGSEQFLTIGNFRDDASTNLQINDKHAFLKLAYLYVDDVFVGLTEPPKVNSSSSAVPISTKLPDLKSGNLRIPNVITPNSDGFNDSFFIENLPRYSELSIFRKDGTPVLRSANYTNDWNGAGFPAGKYRYELKLPDGNVIFGSLDLVKKKL